MIKYSTQSLDTWGEWFLFAALQSSLSMTMCLPLSDFVLTSGGDRQHISSNFFCARSHQHTQPWTHEMTKEPVNKEILSTKTSSFYLFTSSSTQTVSVLVVLQKYPPLCSKKHIAAYISILWTAELLDLETLHFLFYLYQKWGHYINGLQGAAVSHLTLLLRLIQSTTEYALNSLTYKEHK